MIHERQIVIIALLIIGAGAAWSGFTTQMAAERKNLPTTPRDIVCWGLWDNDLWYQNHPLHLADRAVPTTVSQSQEHESLYCYEYTNGAITEHTAKMRWIPNKPQRVTAPNPQITKAKF